MEIALKVFGNSVSYNIIKVYHLSGKPMLHTKSCILWNFMDSVFLSAQTTFVSPHKFAFALFI